MARGGGKEVKGDLIRHSEGPRHAILIPSPQTIIFIDHLLKLILRQLLP
jgi:hypothetical protein